MTFIFLPFLFWPGNYRSQSGIFISLPETCYIFFFSFVSYCNTSNMYIISTDLDNPRSNSSSKKEVWKENTLRSGLGIEDNLHRTRLCLTVLIGAIDLSFPRTVDRLVQSLTQQIGSVFVVQRMTHGPLVIRPGFLVQVELTANRSETTLLHVKYRWKK